MQGVVHHKGRLVIPYDSELVDKKLYECHDPQLEATQGNSKLIKGLVESGIGRECERKGVSTSGNVPFAECRKSHL